MWETLGFIKQKDYFERLLGEGALVHAYLFHGPDMVGKRKFAFELYRLINLRAELKPENDPDLKFVAPPALSSEVVGFVTYSPPKKESSGQEITIHDVRSIRGFLATKPHSSPHKVVIIDNADRMGEEASNALLKMLEEPPPSALFILITAWPERLMPTVLSRCQPVRFMPHETGVIKKSLMSRKISAEDLELLVTLADGRLGWALDHALPSVLKETKTAVADFQNVLKQGIFERMQYAKEIVDSGKVAGHVDIWLRWIRAKGKDPKKTAAALRRLLELSRLVASPEFNHRMALENFLINI